MVVESLSNMNLADRKTDQKFHIGNKQNYIELTVCCRRCEDMRDSKAPEQFSCSPYLKKYGPDVEKAQNYNRLFQQPQKMWLIRIIIITTRHLDPVRGQRPHAYFVFHKNWKCQGNAVRWRCLSNLFHILPVISLFWRHKRFSIWITRPYNSGRTYADWFLLHLRLVEDIVATNTTKSANIPEPCGVDLNL